MNELIRVWLTKGNTEQHQLTLICQLCGSIVPDLWPEVEKLELYLKMELPKGQKRKVKGLNFNKKLNNSLSSSYLLIFPLICF